MSVYKELTGYLANMEQDSYGEWIIDRKSKGTVDDPIQMPYVSHSDMVRHFMKDVYRFIDDHPEYELNRYSDILRANGIEWGTESMMTADVTALDGKCVMALLVGAIRADRFCSGALLNFFKTGRIAKWLLRLKEIDG